MLAHGKHDLSIWEWAEKNAYTVVTADSDFVSMTQKLGWPPKVIHIEQSDFPFRVIEEPIRTSAVRISEFDKSSDVGLLVLRLPRVNPLLTPQSTL